MEINFVSGNANKVRELSMILEPYDIKVNQLNVDLMEIQGSMVAIATCKCAQAKKCPNVKYPLLIEDTSLVFHSMGKLPGPYIKWFLDSMSLPQLASMVSHLDTIDATAYCYLAYLESSTSPMQIFVGSIDGKIVPPRYHISGRPAFGWDPIFEVEGETFSEMDPSYKNSISHRRKALSQLIEYLK